MTELYEEYTNKYKKYIYVFENKDVTLGEIRGKILIMKIFSR